jgi:hypothetical protein
LIDGENAAHHYASDKPKEKSDEESERDVHAVRQVYPVNLLGWEHDVSKQR